MMPSLKLYNRPVTSVFQLLGSKEDDISYSMAWCLVQSPAFLAALLTHLGVKSTGAIENTIIQLQTTEKDKGRTDFEIYAEGEFSIIIEAKKGWNLPTEQQLKMYASRELFKRPARTKLIVSLSECQPYYADGKLPAAIEKIPVRHLPFTEVNRVLRDAHRSTRSFGEKAVLAQFKEYLNKIYRMQQLDTNWVYVVSLGTTTMDGWRCSSVDIVNNTGKYFHPVGNRYPKEPPNYIAFRYYGVLQSIHHIEDYVVSENLSKEFPSLTRKPFAKHEKFFVYTLGKAITREGVRTGGSNIRNRPMWCMLDTLLTEDTIAAAYEESKRRWEIIQNQ